MVYIYMRAEENITDKVNDWLDPVYTQKSNREMKLRALLLRHGKISYPVCACVYCLGFAVFIEKCSIGVEINSISIDRNQHFVVTGSYTCNDRYGVMITWVMKLPVTMKCWSLCPHCLYFQTYQNGSVFTREVKIFRSLGLETMGIPPPPPKKKKRNFLNLLQVTSVLCLVRSC